MEPNKILENYEALEQLMERAEMEARYQSLLAEAYDLQDRLNEVRRKYRELAVKLAN